MLLLITPSKAQKALAENVRARRLGMGLTQEGLSQRAGVSLPTLRKFEQKGVLSLEAFLKLLLIVGGMEEIVKATKPVQAPFSSIDEVLEEKKPAPKRGWRT
jgi:transcriptional regulator with XRE-family HTH domain